MQRDVTYLMAGGGRWTSLKGLTHWLAIGLGGALLLALLLAQAVRAADHTANLTTLSLADSDGATVPLTGSLTDGDTAFTATVLDATAQVTVTAEPETTGDKVTITPIDVDDATTDHEVDLPIGETEITVVVESDATTKTYTITVTRIAAADASLTALSLSAGELDPEFDAGTSSYTASVPNDTADAAEIQSAISVTATAVAGASVSLITPDDDTEASNGASVDLTVGTATLITVTVVAADGTTQQNYTVTATREASDDATLSDLTLDGTTVTGFIATTTEYTSDVTTDDEQITIVATANNSEAEVAYSVADAVADVDGQADTQGHQVDLNVGENVITVTVTAGDGSTQDYTVTVTRAAPDASVVATLSALRVGTLTLAPTFDPQTMAYTASAPFDLANEAEVQNQVAVTATANGDGTFGVLSPADADDATDGHQVDLNVGSNTITVRVTEGVVSNTYTVTVTRFANNDASLSALSLGDDIELSPDFAAGTTSYTASVPNDVDANTDGTVGDISVTATPVAGASVQLITPGTFTAGAEVTTTAIDLTVGTATLITVTVVAADGTTQQNYTVTVTREASDDATLSAFTLSGITLDLDPSDPEATSYTAEVGNAVADTDVTATANNAEAEVEISPADADATTMDAHDVNLDVGENVITATVTAEDGSTQTYTATVTRAALPKTSVSTLSAFSLSGITLDPATFAAETTAYTASVDQFVTSTNVTATATDANTGATVTITPADADDATDGHQVNLDLGENTISAVVASSDGTTVTTYTATVIRAYGGATLTELKLSGVTLSPAFSADVTSYAGSVADDVANTVVTAKAVAGATADPAAVLTEAGERVTLNEGANTINVVVTSSDGTARTTYTVSVFRVHATAHLTALSLGDDVALSPDFAAGTTSYTANVPYETMQVTVTPTAVDNANPVVQDADGMAIEDADAEADGHQVNLDLGANTIMVAVTGGAPAMTSTYTVVVNRGASTDATLSSLELSGVTLSPAFEAGTTTYSASVANDVASTTVTATAADTDATVEGAGQMDLAEGTNTIMVTVTAADGATTMTYTVVVARAIVEEVEVEVPGPATTVTVPGPTRTKTVTVPGPTRTKTVTETVTVEVPAPPNVIGGTMSAMATEVDGRVLITRHDGGPSLVVDIGGFIRDASLGQTYQVVRRGDGLIVRQWVSPNSPLVYQIPWAVVNTQFTVPVGVIMAIPLDDQSGSEGQLVRRFDGGDDRIFSYAGMGQWRHVPDIATFQALGYYWCDVTAADSAFFDRVNIGPAHPATDQPASMDYPTCSTG